MEFISFQFDVVIDLVSRGGLWCMLSKVCHLIFIIVGGSFANKIFVRPTLALFCTVGPSLVQHLDLVC